MKKVTLAGCVLLKENKILLLHRIKQDSLELPGGKINEGEQPEQAAIRELKEELGCEVEIISQLGQKDFYENGEVKGYMWFLAKITRGEPIICEPQTFDRYTYIPLQDLSTTSLSLNMQNLAQEIQEGTITLPKL